MVLTKSQKLRYECAKNLTAQLIAADVVAAEEVQCWDVGFVLEILNYACAEDTFPCNF